MKETKRVGKGSYSFDINLVNEKLSSFSTTDPISHKYMGHGQHHRAYEQSRFNGTLISARPTENIRGFQRNEHQRWDTAHCCNPQVRPSRQARPIAETVHTCNMAKKGGKISPRRRVLGAPRRPTNCSIGNTYIESQLSGQWRWGAHLWSNTGNRSCWDWSRGSRGKGTKGRERRRWEHKGGEYRRSPLEQGRRREEMKPPWWSEKTESWILWEPFWTCLL